MKTLSAMHLVQFSFWDFETFNLRQGGTAFLGPNGAGKTSLVDAVQIALVGGHGQHMHFNTQSVHKDHRSVKDYALGTMRSNDDQKGVVGRKRDEALSYITLVFEGSTPADVVSAGICLHSLASEKAHRTLGLFILPGVRLELDHHLGALDSGGVAPLDWTTFDALARDLAKKAGRTPTFTAKPETYVDELLHALQHKGRSIDRDKFLRALGQSLRLKGIQSVNDFLRGYLVDAQPIDKQGTLRHIRTVRSLVRQIEEVEEQLTTLGDIDRRLNQVANLYKTKATAAAVKVQLQVEGADAAVGALLASEAEDDTKLQAIEGGIGAMAEEGMTLRAAHEELLAIFNRDPAAQRPEQARELRSARLSIVKEGRRAVERAVLQVRDALSSAASALSQAKDEGAAAMSALTAQWEARASRGELPSAEDVASALSRLRSTVNALEHQHEQDLSARKAAADRLQAAVDKVRAADKGMRLSADEDDDVSPVMRLFTREGIDSQTVASLVSVRNANWQAAIESFLGRHRFSLVVTPGRENDAVRLLRHASPPHYGVTVVQPYHLRQDLSRTPDPSSVASLLSGDHELALAYLRRILGRMLQVRTEDELREHDRALTADGMLSANGTRRIRLIDPKQWVLGVKITGAEKQALRDEVITATRADEAAAAQLKVSKEADERVRELLRTASESDYRLLLTNLATAQGALETGAVPATDLPQHLLELQGRIAEARRLAEQAETRHRDASSEAARLRQRLSTTRGNLTTAREQLERFLADQAQALADQDYDGELADAMYRKAYLIQETEGAVAAVTSLHGESNGAATRLLKAEADASAEMRGFINAMSLNLIDERSDWRKAAIWVKARIRQLNDSTLVQYKKDADAARDAANMSFRADVAYRMREAILRVENDIKELNRILAGCPEFTGGEKYQFVADPSTTHRDLYKLITESAKVESGTMPLFEATEGVQKTLVKFLEDCEKGIGKDDNPLEDYRLLFNFDLDILVNNKKVDSLSKRLGVGSNGEHLVPFYVIAGASLANAYRIKAGEVHDGAAVMIIDEAFHGFDAQNTYSTGEFLRSLGLQPVMAAPDADVGKLTPVIQSYYDLERSGSDVFTEEVIIKPQAHKLLESDMPSRNPQLVAKTIEQMTLA